MNMIAYKNAETRHEHCVVNNAKDEHYVNDNMMEMEEYKRLKKGEKEVSRRTLLKG